MNIYQLVVFLHVIGLSLLVLTVTGVIAGFMGQWRWTRFGVTAVALLGDR